MKYSLVVFLILFSSAFSQPEIPNLKMWATDLTNTLSQSELNELNTRLKTYQDTTSNQIVVLMITSLEGYPIEMLSEETATKNKIGTKKNDNGILLLIAKADRELRLEVGYGLEGVLPEAIVNSTVVDFEMIPRFKENDYYGGISNGVKVIMNITRGEYTAEQYQQNYAQNKTGSDIHWLPRLNEFSPVRNPSKKTPLSRYVRFQWNWYTVRR